MPGRVSAVSWVDSQVHLRVYQDRPGIGGSRVIERAFDGQDWQNGAFSEEGVTVGATSWLEGDQIHIRVYVGNGSDGPITEYCWDKDHWYVGAFQANGTNADPTSWLTGDQIHIRVYVRDMSDTVVEHCWDGKEWYKGAYTD